MVVLGWAFPFNGHV